MPDIGDESRLFASSASSFRIGAIHAIPTDGRSVRLTWGNGPGSEGEGRPKARGTSKACVGHGDGGALIQSRHMRLSILLEMKLAALPGHGGEDGGAGGPQAGMVIADEEKHTMQATLLQRAQKGAPMNLRFAQNHTDAENGGLPSGPMPKAMSTAQSSRRPPWRTFS